MGRARRERAFVRADGPGRRQPPARRPPSSRLSIPPALPSLPPPPGRLHSVDQYLNIKLADVRQPSDAASAAAASPALASVRNAFIRGSVVRDVLLPPAGVDAELLHDATRLEARGPG